MSGRTQRVERIERYADLAQRVLATTPRLGAVRLVAVDGAAGSGKTTFADRLTVALCAAGARTAEVHTDDLLDGWDDVLTFWPRLETQVLAPLRRGERSCYRRYDWTRARFGEEWVTLSRPDVVVLEGVSAARVEVHPELSLAVVVLAGRAVRLARGLERDGWTSHRQWLRWMAVEERHFGQDRPSERADLLVEGAAETPYDPTVEFVVRTGG